MDDRERNRLKRLLLASAAGAAAMTPVQARERLKQDEDTTKLVTESFANAPYNEYKHSIEHAMHDYSLPAFVRATLVILTLPATEGMILREAKVDVKTYARYNGKACRMTLASNMGDIGISYSERDMGYDVRGLSVYDLTDFSPTPLFARS
jgi:hypothetical protein